MRRFAKAMVLLFILAKNEGGTSRVNAYVLFSPCLTERLDACGVSPRAEYGRLDIQRHEGLAASQLLGA